MRSAPSRQVVVAGALALAALAPGPAAAATPVGYLDAASCDVIAGWSQDPDEPDKAIDVHLYLGGPAGTPGVPAVATNAGIHREDLCTAIGSCAHGFVVLSPLSLHDGQPRPVHAYGIDSQGGPNPELGGSPQSLACPPGAPAGVRREVTDVHSLAAWRFESFWDLLPLGAAEADALPEGPALPDAPVLVQADDGAPEVWLLDRGFRRAVPGGAVAPWRFDPAGVEVRPAAEIQALVEGPPLRPRPVIFVRGKLWLLDDPQPEGQGGAGSTTTGGAGGAGGAGGGDGGAGGGGGADGGADGGCAFRGAPGDDARGLLGGLAVGAAILACARRRRGARSFRCRSRCA